MEHDTIATILYYFTGTGNTLALARQISQQTEVKMVAISGCRKKETVDPQADTVIVLTPVYYGDLPLLMQDFLTKLSLLPETRTLLILTHSGDTGRAADTAAALVQGKGVELSAVLAIHMPHNAIRRTGVDREMLYQTAAESLTVHLKAFLAGEPVETPSQPTPRTDGPGTPAYLYDLIGVAESTPIREAMHWVGTTFALIGECHGCGMCLMSCPVDNIVMVDRKPQWLDHCENCLACYNQCPHRSIATTLVEDGVFYHHPDLNFKDLVKQKRLIV